MPPSKGSRYKGRAEAGWEKERDAAIAGIHGFGGDEIGRRLWKACSVITKDP